MITDAGSTKQRDKLMIKRNLIFNPSHLYILYTVVPFLTDTPKSRQPPSSKLKCTNSNTANVLQTYITVKTSWLFQLQSGYPGCRQTEGTVIMRGLLWYLRLSAQGQLPSTSYNPNTLKTLIIFVVPHLVTSSLLQLCEVHL